MSDEEKKAIVELNHFSNMTAYWKEEEYTNGEIDNYIITILNLIERQQKEIEDLKDKYSDEKIRNTVIKRFKEVIEKDYISKDKIKAKIKECENKKNVPHEIDIKAFYKIEDLKNIEIAVLKSLLEKE